jgi:hypothetical protein
LGAGASCPYGFPSGRQLRHELIDLEFVDRPDSAAWGEPGMVHPGRKQAVATHAKWLEAASRDPKKHALMAREFKLSGCTSIDAFVANRREFASEAKFSIAGILLARENLNPLFDPSTEGNWYEYFWNKLCGTADACEDVPFERFRIFTFNYDRSLEAYLLHALCSRFNISTEDAATQLKRLEIVHAYGCLGAIYPYFVGGIAYGRWDENFHHFVKVASDNLRLIPDSRSAGERDVFETARSWLADATEVFFLGYGFDPLNDERLAFGRAMQYLKRETQAAPTRTIFATMMGLSHNEQIVARSRYQEGFAFEDRPCDSLELLRYFPFG